MKVIDNLNDFIEQVDNSKKTNPLDLSKDQDLSIAIMNLVSIEEHLIFSGAKTKDTSFYDMVETIREYRKDLLQNIIKTYKGEVWCISKHLLAASMRLMEVGTKLLHDEKKTEAYEFFDKSYNLYCLFWGLNIQNISDDKTKKIIQELNKKNCSNYQKSQNTTNTQNKSKNMSNSNIINLQKNFYDLNDIKIKKNTGILNKMKSFINKSLDCCRE